MEGYGKIALEQEACELNFKRVGRERERDALCMQTTILVWIHTEDTIAGGGKCAL